MHDSERKKVFCSVALNTICVINRGETIIILLHNFIPFNNFRVSKKIHITMKTANIKRKMILLIFYFYNPDLS